MKEIIVNPVTLIKNGEEVPIHGITDVNKVSDVQINGESVVSDGVATIPLATDTKHGIAIYRSTDYRTGIKITSFDGTTGIVSLNPATESRIASRTGNMAITPQNLEYAVTSVVDFEEGTSEQATFVEESDLEHYVKDTNIATATKAGLVKPDTTYAVKVFSNGGLSSEAKTLAQYNSSTNNMFVSKGTLENIKESLVKSVGDDIYEPKKEAELVQTITLEENVPIICYESNVPLKAIYFHIEGTANQTRGTVFVGVNRSTHIWVSDIGSFDLKAGNSHITVPIFKTHGIIWCPYQYSASSQDNKALVKDDDLMSAYLYYTGGFATGLKVTIYATRA